MTPSLSGQRLVIFGCGYVGTEVALEAQARGVRVTALTRNPSNAILLRNQNIDTVVAELASADWHEKIDRAELVLNCVSSGGAGLDGYRRSYVEGMESILRWAEARGGVGTIVYTSSTSVYPQDGGVTVDETSPAADPSAPRERPAVLRAAEALLENSSHACDRWFILRLAGIYGPGRHHFVNQVKTGEASGHGTHHLNLAHRDDIVSAIWKCFAAPGEVRNEIFNVADDAPARKADVAAWLAAELKLPPPRFTGEPAGGRRAVTPDRIISNARLKTRLGWQPRYPSFREGCANLLSH